MHCPFFFLLKSALDIETFLMCPELGRLKNHVWCIANMTVRSLKLLFTSERNALQAFRKLQNVE